MEAGRHGQSREGETPMDQSGSDDAVRGMPTFGLGFRYLALLLPGLVCIYLLEVYVLGDVNGLEIIPIALAAAEGARRYSVLSGSWPVRRHAWRLAAAQAAWLAAAFTVIVLFLAGPPGLLAFPVMFLIVAATNLVCIWGAGHMVGAERDTRADADRPAGTP